MAARAAAGGSPELAQAYEEFLDRYPKELAAAKREAAAEAAYSPKRRSREPTDAEIGFVDRRTNYNDVEEVVRPPAPAPRKVWRAGQTTSLQRGAASLRRLDGFERWGPRIGQMQAAEGATWEAVARTRADWDRATFAGDAAAVLNGCTSFYRAVRAEFATAGELDAALAVWPRYSRENWIADFRRYGIGPELAARMKRAAPPPRLRAIFNLAARVLRDVGAPLDLEPERGVQAQHQRVDDGAAIERKVQVDILLFGHSVARAFGGRSKRRVVDLLAPALVATMYAVGTNRGGPVAAAQTAASMVLGRSRRDLGEQARRARTLGLVPTNTPRA